MERRTISTGTTWEPVVGYSRAVRVGPHVFVSGTTSVDEAGEVVGRGDPYAQACRVLTIIEESLHRAGARMEDVVRTRIFVRHITDWEAIGRAHGEVFGHIRPASTMVEISSLIDPALLVEIEADAIVT